MSAKQDIQNGVTADLTVSRDQVVQACRQGFDSLTGPGRFEDNGSQLTVRFTRPTLGGLVTGSKKQRHMGTIAIKLTERDGGIHLDTVVERYVTVQSKLYGLIPAGPKRLQGRERYFKLFDALETELRATDPSGQVVRRRP